jgi:phage/plasmid-like protein (TIGR03299 family)
MIDATLATEDPLATAKPTADSAAEQWLFGKVEKETYATAADALEGLGLDWEVAMTQSIKGFTEDGEEVDFNENKGIYRVDTKDPLSVMGTVYEVIQNQEALEMFESIISNGDVAVAGGGVFKKGKRIWVACRLPGNIKIGMETILRYIIISWSHNGEASLSASFVPWLQNRKISLANVLPGVKSSISIKHTTNFQARIAAAADVMSTALAFFQKAEQVLNDLASEQMDMEKFKNIIDYLYPDGKTTSKRVSANEKRKENLVSEFSDPTKPFAGTALSLIFADTEDADNGRIRKTKGRGEHEARLDSNLFGTASRRKNNTMRTILTWNEITAKQKAKQEREEALAKKNTGGIA